MVAMSASSRWDGTFGDASGRGMAWLTRHRYLQATNEKLKGLNTLTFSVWMSRGAGLCLSLDGTMILLPMCRTLLRWIRPKLKFLPLDESQFFHRQVAYAMLFWTCVHVSAHYVKWVPRSRPFPKRRG
jgi:hypothetical protein